MPSTVTVRTANREDFRALYELGLATPELQVSSVDPFMGEDEFAWSLTNPDGVFLLAEEDSRVVGFIYASAKDPERPMPHKWACLVYLVVSPEFRGRGIAQTLYDRCVDSFRERGITNLYVWANTGGDAQIITFMEKQGFARGHMYMWMDKKI
jgi:GNAT superfamily N-acetyltransferase